MLRVRSITAGNHSTITPCRNVTVHSIVFDSYSLLIGCCFFLQFRGTLAYITKACSLTVLLKIIYSCKVYT